ncbi:metalloregulator ArsR/SmtB family transcription factor [Eubacteriaceae bacterium ES3]|nr:metalloregulator ArsR/SmtB family transcription factor [Eubacteriaceae bacterium ES3]
MDKNLFEFEENAELLKALAHPVRLCIVKGLLTKECCNVSYMEECLGVSQPTISQHLGKLKNAGIVKGTRNGNEINYELVNEKVKDLIKILYSEVNE